MQEANQDNIMRPTENDTSIGIVSEYTVEERDTVADIEKKFDLTWEQVVAANKDILQQGEAITPGMRLKIPTRQ
jgi:nucleoid-associated protein YgaU